MVGDHILIELKEEPLSKLIEELEIEVEYAYEGNYF